jgi:hypothetical protein
MDAPLAAGRSFSKAKQASRSVSLLTPEQLVRKRAQDRESQRQTRQALFEMLIGGWDCGGFRVNLAQVASEADNCRT